MKRREVHELGAADADVEHVDAGVREPLDERLRDRRARGADVPADGDRPRRDEFGITPSDPVRDVLVELFGHAPANVIGFETSDALHSFAGGCGSEDQYTHAVGEFCGLDGAARL